MTYFHVVSVFASEGVPKDDAIAIFLPTSVAGRNHLGAITGKVMSIIILASALAPPIFSFCFSTFGSYRLLGYLGLAFLLLALASLRANSPQ